jgi:pimeloyl-ACP methyl ester carboxylesterase
LLLTSALAACSSSPPLSARRASADTSRRTLVVNALANGEISEDSRITLRRHDLSDLYRKDPNGAIEALHDRMNAKEGEVWRELYTLAEISFLRADALRRNALQHARNRARRSNQRAPRPKPELTEIDLAELETSRSYYLAAAIYAMTMLFDKESRGVMALINPHARLMADIYNRAVVGAFWTPQEGLEFEPGLYTLPFGALRVAIESESFIWGSRRLKDFIPVTEFAVRGLNNRYRQSGIGAPLAAHTEPIDPNHPARDLVSSHTVVSSTAVLLVPNPRLQLKTRELYGSIRLYAGNAVKPIPLANGQVLPLELDPSVALAVSLEESGIWKGNLAKLLGRALPIKKEDRLFGWEPRLPGQIPVVLVHGTASHPAVWANMVNDLQSEEQIRDRFLFLFYAYESGSPILYSSMILRRSLTDAVRSLDPSGQDPCLQDMVVIGHSQGGLLTKVTSIDSGDRFWRVMSDQPFEQADLSPRSRALLAEAVFVEPLPFVDRVIFISTPHRGSFLASPDLVRRLAARLIRIPAEMVELTGELAGLSEDSGSELRLQRISTSIDNMSPRTPFIRTISGIPVAPSVTAHSIIAVQGEGPPEPLNDGVVQFSSAHIEEAVSEEVVRSGHSTQANPHTIEEVRRILLEHAEKSTCRQPSATQ